MTRITVYDDFDLEKIADCGQCFRAKKLDQGFYQFVSGEKVVRIREIREDTALSRQDDGIGTYFSEPDLIHSFIVSCSLENWDGFWKDYFDLARIYDRIRTLCAEKFSAECDGTRQFLEKAQEALVL